MYIACLENLENKYIFIFIKALLYVAVSNLFFFITMNLFILYHITVVKTINYVVDTNI